jgi:hypothetical protein
MVVNECTHQNGTPPNLFGTKLSTLARAVRVHMRVLANVSERKPKKGKAKVRFGKAGNNK